MDDADGDTIAGLPVEEAVERVSARESRDPEAVRADLERVAEDGRVTREGVEGAIADVSQAVSTPENRIGIVDRDLAEARDAAEPVADLGAVRSRLEGFESRRSALRIRTEELGEDLEDIVDRRGDPGAIPEIAREIRDLTRRASDVHREIDGLIHEIGAFERWVADPERRVEELAADVDGAAESIEELADAVDEVAAGSGPARAWADAALRRRAMELLVADLRAEREDLRTWAEREGLAEPDAGIADRLDDLEARLDALGERLDDVARPAWRDRFGGRIERFGAALDGMEPPIDWGEVHGTLEEHRP